MRITILGSGTSVGVPMVGCDCPTCRSSAPENKRLRCSVYVEHPGGKFLIDCSTDFREQALRYKMPRIDALLVTHPHADHINGIDDLRVYNFRQEGAIPVFCHNSTLQVLETRFDYCFNPIQIGGGLPHLDLREITPGQAFHLDGLEVMPIALKHGVLDVLGFRLGSRFAYLTDCSEVPQASLEQVRGVDVLVVDALRHTPHDTHFCLEEALAFSRKVGAAQTWFTHISCYLEHFETNAMLPPEAQLLRDGQVLEISDAPMGREK
jgi:phosphoribosyl 1,2-cyclic phosphate phosphodiesterase